MSQPLVYKFENQMKLDAQARKLGFSKIVYTNGLQRTVGKTWTIDLKQ